MAPSHHETDPLDSDVAYKESVLLLAGWERMAFKVRWPNAPVSWTPPPGRYYWRQRFTLPACHPCLVGWHAAKQGWHTVHAAYRIFVEIQRIEDELKRRGGEKQ